MTLRELLVDDPGFAQVLERTLDQFVPNFNTPADADAKPL
jgi:hypothetical protein